MTRNIYGDQTDEQGRPAENVYSTHRAFLPPDVQARADAEIGAAWRRLVALTDWCDLTHEQYGYQVDCDRLLTDSLPTALEALTAAIEAIELLREPG